MYLVGVAQLVRAPDCGSGCRGFESLYPPQTGAGDWEMIPVPCFFPMAPQILGCRQAVRHGTLTPAFAGSSPAIPANDPLAQSAEQLPFKQWVRGSNPRRVTIKSKRYRCHWRKASGIYRFRVFFARKFTNDSIDANHCFPLTGGIRTPFFRRLANSEPCGALFKAVIFKKGAIFLSIEYTKFEASICWSRRAIELAPFLFSDKFKKGTKYQEVVNEPRTVFSGASHRSPP